MKRNTDAHNNTSQPLTVVGAEPVAVDTTLLK